MKHVFQSCVLGRQPLAGFSLIHLRLRTRQEAKDTVTRWTIYLHGNSFNIDDLWLFAKTTGLKLGGPTVAAKVVTYSPQPHLPSSPHCEDSVLGTLATRAYNIWGSQKLWIVHMKIGGQLWDQPGPAQAKLTPQIVRFQTFLLMSLAHPGFLPSICFFMRFFFPPRCGLSTIQLSSSFLWNVHIRERHFSIADVKNVPRSPRNWSCRQSWLPCQISSGNWTRVCLETAMRCLILKSGFWTLPSCGEINLQ